MQSNLQWTEREAPTKHVGFRADPEWVERLDGICNESGISKADFIRLAVSQLMAKMAR